MKVNGNQNLAANILLNIFFYVPQKKWSHTDMEQHEG